MAPELAERVEAAWIQSKESHRIGLSDFSHGRKWRSELAECGVMEILDRDKTCAWLVSYECMDAMMLRIAELEDMLEEISIKKMIQSRADDAHFVSGPLSMDEIMAILKDNPALVEDMGADED